MTCHAHAPPGDHPEPFTKPTDAQLSDDRLSDDRLPEP